VLIVDASPLIALAKIGRLTLFRDVYGEVGIGPEVKSEVIERGRPMDMAGVRQVEVGLEVRWILEFEPTAREKALARQLLAGTRLGQDEAESIILAQSRELTAVLDDKEARIIAGTRGVRHVGTAGVLWAAFVNGSFTLDELEEVVRDLAQVLWLSPDVVAEILRRARGLDR
jgi:predicted nucleic acid-binding protein